MTHFIQHHVARRPAFFAPFLLGAVLATSTGCVESGSGEMEERTEEVEAYTSISVDNSINASVKMGEAYAVLIRGDDNMIDDVQFRQVGNRVEVHFTRDNVSNVTLEAEFTLPLLAGAKVDDSSQLVADLAVLADNVVLEVEDSSRLTLTAAGDSSIDSLDLSCEDSSDCEVDVMTTGAVVDVDDSSHVRISGAAVNLQLDVEDSSSFEGKSFETESVNLEVSDSSSAQVFASKEAKGSAQDSSQVTVYGGGNVDISTRDSSSVSEK